MRALFEWFVKRSKLYVNMERELYAAVEYHANYRNKIDIELGQPRDSGDMLSNHLAAIRRLKEPIPEPGEIAKELHGKADRFEKLSSKESNMFSLIYAKKSEAYRDVAESAEREGWVRVFGSQV